MLHIWELVLKLLKNGPLPPGHHSIVHFQQSVRTIFLKPVTVGNIPRGGTEWETASVLKLEYIGRKRNNITDAGNGREVLMPVVLNVKIDG